MAIPRLWACEYDVGMPDAAPQSRCYACGYDLRGNTSGTCPECGRTSPLAIAIADPEQFHFARAMLERDGLLLSSIDPGGSMGTMAIVDIGGFKTGWLWIDQKHADHVGELLDEHGITTNINSRPIVDRNEPYCPTCNEKLDIFGREQCRTCGTLFQWVDVGDREFERCDTCNYDLTGLSERRCPECGTPFDEEPEPGTPEPQSAKQPNDHLMLGPRTIFWLCLLPVLLVFAMLISDWTIERDSRLRFIGVGIALAVIAGVLSLARKK